MARPYILRKLRDRKPLSIESANKEILRDRERNRKIPKKDIRVRLLDKKITGEKYTVSAVTRIFINPKTENIHLTNCLSINQTNIYPTKNGGKIKLGSYRALMYYGKKLDGRRTTYGKSVMAQYIDFEDLYDRTAARQG